MHKFYNQSMQKILNVLEKELRNESSFSFLILNPDSFKSIYSGTVIKIDDDEYIYRGYKAWSDLAQKFFCRVLTPKIVSENIVELTFEKIEKEMSFHRKDVDKEEKYGIDSIFSQINKNEEPEVLYSYLQALDNVKVGQRKRILNLGVNSGEEFDAIKDYCKEFKDLELIGIDYCESAIKKANAKFNNDENIKLYAHDINDLDSLSLGKFDLIISIGTLQSSNLEFNKIFMDIVQNYLNKDGSMILGFPNCRWMDGEIIYGAIPPNYNFSEMSILYKDAIFCKKYLQQKKFRVTLTGMYYIFLTATSIRKD